MSSKSFISPEEKRRKEIDRTIEKQLKQIVVLRTERNQLAPISRLPPEVMSNIFAYVKMPSFRFEQTSAEALVWIVKVSHVSSHWRSIALNTPTLWTDLPLFNPRWTTEMTKRSKMAGLSFDFNVSKQICHLDSVLTQVLEHSSRIRRLVLSGASNNIQKFMDALPMSLPGLETLCVHGYAPTYSWGNVVPQHVLVPAGLLTGATKLREVELSNFKVDWAPHLLNNSITQLKIHDISPIAAPTLTQFMDALQNLTELCSLDISITFQTIDSHEKGRISSQIYLTKLQKLNISFTNGETETFFRRVTFPPSAIVEVSTRDNNISREAAPNGAMNVSAIITAISRLYSNGPSYFRSLVLDNHTSANAQHIAVRFRLYTKPCLHIQYLPPACDSHHLSLSFRWIRPDVIKYEKAFTDLFSNELPLQGIDDVCLLYIDDVKPETLAQTVGSLPNVLNIRSSGDIGNVLIAALQLPSNDVNADSMENLCFSKLSKLYLNELAFENCEAGTHGPHDIAVEKFEDCLIQRYESGKEIMELVLDDCIRVDKEIVEQLRNIVVNVSWDECEQGFEASDGEVVEEGRDDYSVDFEDEVDYGGYDYYDSDDYSYW